MNHHGEMLLWGLVTTLVFFTLVWLLSLGLRKASVVDAFWGIGFIVLSSFYAAFGGNLGKAKVQVVLALVSLWGIRLSAYLTWRNWGQPEDYRYAEMRKHWGERFWWVSLFTVFLFQGFLLWILGMPLYFLLTNQLTGWSGLDLAGLAVFALGFAFETVADWQLASFKRNPANSGKLMKDGLWRYSRHPNYFGEALVWWGLFLLAASNGGWWAIVSPLLMNFLLLRVSGVALLERGMLERHPEYAEYARRTNAFLPWAPKK